MVLSLAGRNGGSSNRILKIPQAMNSFHRLLNRLDFNPFYAKIRVYLIEIYGKS